jgi:hypothetical protein
MLIKMFFVKSLAKFLDYHKEKRGPHIPWRREKTQYATVPAKPPNDSVSS